MSKKDCIRFTKMHGAGNDYIYVNAMECCPENPNALSIAVSDRHKGVGSDGLVLIMPSEVADFRMRMFNADGSEAQMCGNASRCIAKYVYDKGLTTKTQVTLETMKGIKILNMHLKDGVVDSVTVDMGEPILEPNEIPVVSNDGNNLVAAPISTAAGEYRMTSVSMGNPHGVIFVEDLDKVDVHTTGRELEIHPIWPEKANIEFAQVLNNHEIKMRVWERGSGETMACGTGACATTVAAVLEGRTDREVTMHLLGGDLHIVWDEATNHVMMTGPAEFICDGEFYF